MPTPRTPEEGVPFLTMLQRMLPSMLGGQGGDQRLPMEAGQARDPRLPPPSLFDTIQGGLDQVKSLGGPDPKASAAMEALKRQR